jgi:hypothetical protein
MSPFEINYGLWPSADLTQDNSNEDAGAAADNEGQKETAAADAQQSGENERGRVDVASNGLTDAEAERFLKVT